MKAVMGSLTLSKEVFRWILAVVRGISKLQYRHTTVAI